MKEGSYLYSFTMVPLLWMDWPHERRASDLIFVFLTLTRILFYVYYRLPWSLSLDSLQLYAYTPRTFSRVLITNIFLFGLSLFFFKIRKLGQIISKVPKVLKLFGYVVLSLKFGNTFSRSLFHMNCHYSLLVYWLRVITRTLIVYSL